MIRSLALAASFALVSASARAQIACLPPEEPYRYEPPQDDPELRAIINEQYETYVLDVECPSSDDLGQMRLISNGGSGPS